MGYSGGRSKVGSKSRYQGSISNGQKISKNARIERGKSRRRNKSNKYAFGRRIQKTRTPSIVDRIESISKQGESAYKSLFRAAKVVRLGYVTTLAAVCNTSST